MSSQEQDRKTERELRLAKLEGDFYKTCSAVRYQGIEIDGIRNCLMQELLEIEENKNLELRREIEELQVAAMSQLK